MSSSISFRCSSCRARIKAPVQLIGQARSCPGCGHRFVVNKVIPRDADTVLVLDETRSFLRLRPRIAAGY
jgi:DNA-directed RNA polymerase subunit RPC12/RpoP